MHKSRLDSRNFKEKFQAGFLKDFLLFLSLDFIWNEAEYHVQNLAVIKIMNLNDGLVNDH